MIFCRSDDILQGLVGRAHNCSVHLSDGYSCYDWNVETGSNARAAAATGLEQQSSRRPEAVWHQMCGPEQNQHVTVV